MILTPELLARGIEMRSQKPPVSWQWAACQISVSPYALRCALEPGYADRHRENVRRRRAGLVSKPAPRPQKERQSEATFNIASSVPIPRDVLADRDRRMAMQPRSLTAALMGDPPAADWHKRA